MYKPEQPLTLVPLDAAYRFRDEGIRFAYLKSGFIGALAASNAFLALFIGMHKRVVNGDLYPWLFLVLTFAAMVAAVWCYRNLEFPNSLRVSRQELDTMRDGMGISAEVFQRTHDSVIHGLRGDFEADQKVEELLQKAKSANLRTN